MSQTRDKSNIVSHMNWQIFLCLLSRAKGGLKRAVLQVLVLEIILWVFGSRISGSVGGVLFDPAGQCLRFSDSGEEVPPHIMRDLFARSKNPIHELEVLPVFVAALLWGEANACSQVVYYIDNESSRMAYIRGDGETTRSSALIQSFVETEAKLQHRVWFGRVPSCSNPADGPCRLSFSEVMELGATRTKINWEEVSPHLGSGAETGRC